MAHDAVLPFGESYQAAQMSGLLPGVILMAESREGRHHAALETSEFSLPNR